MIQAIVLDSSPLGIATAGPKNPQGALCRQWMANCITAGITVYLPEIADYEVRRELIRTNAVASIQRLDALKAMLQYLPITTAHMLHAADLWASIRNAGIATADKHALDGDVILCAQALSLGLGPADIVVATGNVKHISRFVAADLWSNINP